MWIICSFSSWKSHFFAQKKLHPCYTDGPGKAPCEPFIWSRGSILPLPPWALRALLTPTPSRKDCTALPSSSLGRLRSELVDSSTGHRATIQYRKALLSVIAAERTHRGHCFISFVSLHDLSLTEGNSKNNEHFETNYFKV